MLREGKGNHGRGYKSEGLMLSPSKADEDAKNPCGQRELCLRVMQNHCRRDFFFILVKFVHDIKEGCEVFIMDGGGNIKLLKSPIDFGFVPSEKFIQSTYETNIYLMAYSPTLQLFRNSETSSYADESRS